MTGPPRCGGRNRSTIGTRAANGYDSNKTCGGISSSQSFFSSLVSKLVILVRKFYAYGGVPLGPLPGLGCCAHGQLGGCVPVAGWLFHESSSGGVLVQSLLIAAAGR